MILVDTSVWVDHFRQADARVALLAANLELVQHPYVTGELAMGNLHEWRQTVDRLRSLPQVDVAPQENLLDFIECNELAGSGIGFVDAHLLLSCDLSRLKLWTRDSRLAREADRLALAYSG